jgi:hypothetical protein
MNLERFYRGFISELSKVGAKPRTIGEIAKGQPPRTKLPENREPPVEPARGAGVAA